MTIQNGIFRVLYLKRKIIEPLYCASVRMSIYLENLYKNQLILISNSRAQLMEFNRSILRYHSCEGS